MELLVLSTEFISLKTVDGFESLIWTDRYNKPSDFELSLRMTIEMFQLLAPDNYLYLEESNKVMIIENRKIETNAETGNHLIIAGRSLEATLDRRIVWTQTILDGNLQTEIQRLLNENVISPTDSDRIITNFIFESSTDPDITGLAIYAQFTGDNLLDVITAICEAYSIGFSIELNDSDQLVFKLYSGEDRSYEQLNNPYVEFSPNFNNLIGSNYLESKKLLKTVTLVAGEGEGIDRISTEVSLGQSGTGLNRREFYTDARDVSSNVDGNILLPAEYLDLLIQRGISKLSETTIIQSFEGQVENFNEFKYGEDFFLGDIVQIVNKYGLESRVRITEVIRSQSASGIEIYPTFSTV